MLSMTPFPRSSMSRAGVAMFSSAQLKDVNTLADGSSEQRTNLPLVTSLST